ncbi:capsule biosynthesis protein CapA, partial [Escherichia coli]|nr:capsule biosynthesis protein CapA [Escherichia coli]
ISRTATLPAYTNKALRGTLLSLYNSKLDVKKFLDYVFGIDVSNNEIAKKIARDLKLNLTSDSSKHKKEIAQFIHKYYDSTEYSNTLEQKNEHLIEYVTNIIGNDSFAVFDLGTRGTSRDILSDILGINIPLYMFRETKHKC